MQPYLNHQMPMDYQGCVGLLYVSALCSQINADVQDVEKDAKAELASGSGKKQSKSSKKAEEAAPDFMPQEDLESFGEGR